MKKLPAHIQRTMNRPSVPISEAVNALHNHAEANPEEASGILSPVLKDLAAIRITSAATDPSDLTLE